MKAEEAEEVAGFAVLYFFAHTQFMIGTTNFTSIGILVGGLVFYAGVIVLVGMFRRSQSATATAGPGIAAAGAARLPGEAENIPDSLLPRAGFWIRLLATLLDAILVGMVVAGVFHRPKLFLLTWVIYHLALWSWRGTTVGGSVFGLKIVRLDDRPMGVAVAAVRLLGSFFSAAALGLGFLWVAWSRDHQSWHDKMAGTVVVKSPRGRSLI